jgi:hypothetical protein
MSDLNNQSQILLNLEKHHSDQYGFDYYDIGQLPKALADEYWKDHMIAARPAIHGVMSVYTWDFESWRERYLKQLMMSDVKVKTGHD